MTNDDTVSVIYTTSDMFAQRRFISACALAVWSDSSLVAFWIVKDASLFMRTTKTLIRLRGCAGWLESSLGVHVIRHVFSRYGTLDVMSEEIPWHDYLVPLILRGKPQEFESVNFMLGNVQTVLCLDTQTFCGVSLSDKAHFRCWHDITSI